MKKTDRKIALVTGASGDIGMSAAKALLEKEYFVIMHSHKNKDRVNTFIKENNLHDSTLHISCNASVEKEVSEVFKQIESSNIKHIDVLVNNAGDLIARKPVEDLTWSFIQESIDANTKSAVLFTLYTLTLMNNPGSIIFIASLTARCGQGDRSSAYSLSKGAILSWSKNLAYELGPRKIRVNTISPGYIEGQFHQKYTRMEVGHEHAQKNPLKRNGTPDDIAQAVVFLASMSSDGYVSGTNIDVCGASYISY
jgi:3-oxoacyl-[acyl-carrier protein] reductase